MCVASILGYLGYHDGSGLLSTDKVTLSLLSIPFSPLVGLYRVSVMISYLWSQSHKGKEIDSERMTYVTYELVRGSLEILCLGPVFGLIIDPIVALYRTYSQEPDYDFV